jgi:hypothetical protein
MTDLFFIGVVLISFALSGGLVWVLEQLLRRS